MEHTSISSNSVNADLILSTFLSVKETIMLTESKQNPRNSILWVGCKTDLLGEQWSLRNWKLDKLPSLHSDSPVCSSLQESIINECQHCVTQTPQTRQSWFRSLIKIGGESRNPSGRARNSYNFPWKTNKEFLIFWRNFYREISIF